MPMCVYEKIIFDPYGTDPKENSRLSSIGKIRLLKYIKRIYYIFVIVFVINKIVVNIFKDIL